MAELEISLAPKHVVKIDEVEIEFRPAARSGSSWPARSKTVNFTVHCLTCGWEHPSRFRARKAAEVTALEHGDDTRDEGMLLLIVDPWGIRQGSARAWRPGDGPLEPEQR